MTDADVDTMSARDDRRADHDSQGVKPEESDPGETDPRRIDHDDPKVDPERVELLFVVIHDERYAVERGRLRRVVEPAAVTRVPRTPEIVRGVTQISGEVAAVVDARRLFDQPAGDVATGRFVLLERDPHETALALRVDAVETFETVRVDRISIDVEEDLLRASIDVGANDGGHPSTSATTEDDASVDRDSTTGGDRPTPIVDVDAIFEAATV